VTGLDVGRWETFALGQLGASAALLGLVFVGISINLRDLLSSRRLVNRAGEAVVLLATILVSSTVILVPEQPRRAVGVELALVGVAAFAAIFVLQRSLHPAPDSGDTGEADEPMLAYGFRRVLGLGAPLFMFVAAVSLVADGGGGLYWWVVGILLAYIGALLSAWVLLVEILR